MLYIFLISFNEKWNWFGQLAKCMKVKVRMIIKEFIAAGAQIFCTNQKLLLQNKASYEWVVLYWYITCIGSLIWIGFCIGQDTK